MKVSIPVNNIQPIIRENNMTYNPLDLDLHDSNNNHIHLNSRFDQYN